MYIKISMFPGSHGVSRYCHQCILFQESNIDPIALGNEASQSVCPKTCKLGCYPQRDWRFFANTWRIFWVSFGDVDPNIGETWVYDINLCNAGRDFVWEHDTCKHLVVAHRLWFSKLFCKDFPWYSMILRHFQMSYSIICYKLCHSWCSTSLHFFPALYFDMCWGWRQRLQG